MKSPPRITSGFSLIELLVVIGLACLLSALAISAFSSIGQARGVTETAYQLSAAVDLARSEAIARKTYVWLGLQQQTNAGSLDLYLGMVYSKDGSSSTTSSNLQPIGRAIVIQRVGLANTTTLNLPVALSGATELADFSGGASFQIGQVNFNSKRTITITPLGEAMTSPSPTFHNGFDPRIAVGLRQTRGTTLLPGNDVAVVIDGSVGTPSIHRQ